MYIFPTVIKIPVTWGQLGVSTGQFSTFKHHHPHVNARSSPSCSISPLTLCSWLGWAVQDGPSCWALAPLWQMRSFWRPGLDWFGSDYCNHLGSKPVDGESFFSFLKIFPLNTKIFSNRIIERFKSCVCIFFKRLIQMALVIEIILMYKKSLKCMKRAWVSRRTEVNKVNTCKLAFCLRIATSQCNSTCSSTSFSTSLQHPPPTPPQEASWV